MPPSVPELREVPGRAARAGLAVAAEGLYLANLLLFARVGFRCPSVAVPAPSAARRSLAVAHLEQDLTASLWAGDPAGPGQWPDTADGGISRRPYLGPADHPTSPHLPLRPGGARHPRSRQGPGRAVLALPPAGGPGAAAPCCGESSPRPRAMATPTATETCAGFQAGFFALFVLAPPLDLFRLDLTLGHFILFGQAWTLGLDPFLRGEDGRRGGGAQPAVARLPAHRSGGGGRHLRRLALRAASTAAGSVPTSRWWKPSTG